MITKYPGKKHFWHVPYRRSDSIFSLFIVEYEWTLGTYLRHLVVFSQVIYNIWSFIFGHIWPWFVFDKWVFWCSVFRHSVFRLSVLQRSVIQHSVIRSSVPKSKKLGLQKPFFLGLLGIFYLRHFFGIVYLIFLQISNKQKILDIISTPILTYFKGENSALGMDFSGFLHEKKETTKWKLKITKNYILILLRSLFY